MEDIKTFNNFVIQSANKAYNGLKSLIGDIVENYKIS